ncbi:CatB-related O-acetyltransferase [Pedobacter sp. JY14-1]|uniref:CatB-related O-acetyltransferase n=1 Tax=Pedobacter sp. JY14-1 TaxID=3034151 RepID=UPI0023E1ED7D|nr:CatB-related O-acetyltransferase [Pedobacter sp. JY14-1]
MKIFLKFIFVLLHDLSRYFRRRFSYVKLSLSNGTSRFHHTIKVNECKFGRYVVIFENVRIQNAFLNDFSYVQTGSRIFNCSIGKFCSIGPSVSIGPGVHDMSLVSTHPSFVSESTPLPKVFTKGEHAAQSTPVVIGNDVWIGEKAIILDGIKVGNGAVIAAGAVVVRDVEAYSVVGGVPAKVIKYRFDPDTIQLFQKSKWWDFPDEWFSNNHAMMLDKNLFIEYLKCL